MRADIYKLSKLVNSLEDRNSALCTQLDELPQRYARDLEVWKAEYTEKIRADAVARSKCITRGQVGETFAPFIQNTYTSRDFRFFGEPVDYIVFAGMRDQKDKKKDVIDHIVFLDIKTSKSRLNKTQRRIRDCILDGRVYFAVYNPDTNKFKYWPEKESEKCINN